MRALHNRKEDVFEDYLSYYGKQKSIGSPSPASLVVHGPEKKRLSSSRRKASTEVSAVKEQRDTAFVGILEAGGKRPWFVTNKLSGCRCSI